MKTLNKLAGALAIALALLGALTGVALAHAKLVTSDPAADATLTVAPKAVTLWFNEELDTRQSAVTVTAQADNRRVDTGGSKVNLDDRKQISVSLQSPLANGIYVVQWHAVTPDDGGVTDGTFRFTLNAPAQTTVVPTAPPATLTPTATLPAASATPTVPAAATSTPVPPAATPTAVAPTATAVAETATPMPAATLVATTPTPAATTTAPLAATAAPTRAATATPAAQSSGTGAETIALLAGVTILLLGTAALYLMRRQ